MVAGGLVECMFPGDVGVVNTTLSPGTSIAQGVFIEMFMTAELVFVVLMLAAEKSKDTFIAPIGIGLALFVAMMGGMLSLPSEDNSMWTWELTIFRCIFHWWLPQPCT
jgi:aquaporin related protein